MFVFYVKQIYSRFVFCKTHLLATAGDISPNFLTMSEPE